MSASATSTVDLASYAPGLAVGPFAISGNTGATLKHEYSSTTPPMAMVELEEERVISDDRVTESMQLVHGAEQSSATPRQRALARTLQGRSSIQQSAPKIGAARSSEIAGSMLEPRLGRLEHLVVRLFQSTTVQAEVQQAAWAASMGVLDAKLETLAVGAGHVDDPITYGDTVQRPALAALDSVRQEMASIREALHAFAVHQHRDAMAEAPTSVNATERRGSDAVLESAGGRYVASILDDVVGADVESHGATVVSSRPPLHAAAPAPPSVAAQRQSLPWVATTPHASAETEAIDSAAASYQLWRETCAAYLAEDRLVALVDQRVKVQYAPTIAQF
jgi:hypothetical protein